MDGSHEFDADVRTAEVVVDGAPAGLAVSLGAVQMFFTTRADLIVLDGKRFVSIERIEESVRQLRERKRRPAFGRVPIRLDPRRREESQGRASVDRQREPISARAGPGAGLSLAGERPSPRDRRGRA